MLEKKRNISISIIIALSVFLDQISKILIRNNVDQYSDIKLIGEYFILTNVFMSICAHGPILFCVCVRISDCECMCVCAHVHICM